MSLTPRNFGFLPPQNPWKSQWRKDFERSYAESRRAPRKPAPVYVAPKRIRKPKPRKMRTLCSCGRVMLKPETLYCTYCLVRPKKCGYGPKKCVVCGEQVNRTNETGRCKEHGAKVVARQRQRDRVAGGPRPVCKYQADGMKCVQKLYRDNTTGLCCFHTTTRQGTWARIRKPKMEPIHLIPPHCSFPLPIEALMSVE